MLQYPEILGSSKAPIGKQCIAFYKYDGSNLRFEWSPKQGWYKFGTRTQLFDSKHEIFGPAIPLFLTTMGEEIERRCNIYEKGIKRVIAFAEFFGPNSFAGRHEPNDKKELRLIDVALYKRGFMPAREFIKTFGHMSQMAQVIYEGKLTRQFVDDVRRRVYPVWEGVVAKGDDFMVKIKTADYFAKLNKVFGTEYRNYWE